jgi:hypothetical protein
VFTNNSENVDGGFEKNFPELHQIKPIESNWTVDFQNKEIGPKIPVKFETLTDWSLSENEKIKYYSGTAVYSTSFEINEIPENNELYIDLGDVNVMAKVKLNDVDVGGTWMTPHRLKVTEHLIKGTNKLVIEVVNLWRNQLIKDKNLPEDERNTWLLVNDTREDEKLQSSGLLGPVTIQEVYR